MADNQNFVMTDEEARLVVLICVHLANIQVSNSFNHILRYTMLSQTVVDVCRDARHPRGGGWADLREK